MLYALPFWLKRKADIVATVGLYRAVTWNSSQWKSERVAKKKVRRQRGWPWKAISIVMTRAVPKVRPKTNARMETPAESVRIFAGEGGAEELESGSEAWPLAWSADMEKGSRRFREWLPVAVDAMANLRLPNQSGGTEAGQTRRGRLMRMKLFDVKDAGLNHHYCDECQAIGLHQRLAVSKKTGTLSTLRLF